MRVLATVELTALVLSAVAMVVEAIVVHVVLV